MKALVPTGQSRALVALADLYERRIRGNAVLTIP
jgi:hypothetical protein